jgi:hypothetical protein
MLVEHGISLVPLGPGEADGSKHLKGADDRLQSAWSTACAHTRDTRPSRPLREREIIFISPHHRYRPTVNVK